MLQQVTMLPSWLISAQKLARMTIIGMRWHIIAAEVLHTPFHTLEREMARPSINFI